MMIYSVPLIYCLQLHVRVCTNTMCMAINYNAVYDSDIALIAVVHYIQLRKHTVYFVYRYPFTPDQPVQEADWEVYLRETAQQIVEQQTPKR